MSLWEHVRIYLNTPEARVIRLGKVVLESSEVDKDLLEGGPGRNKWLNIARLDKFTHDCEQTWQLDSMIEL